mmetsp:Transcript_8361/g.30916  ORF Transcript_8361/g.30916 Transcript_8361/m.30916 type:complete len:207 (-) Transcript_8361:733-1353(-)
MRFTESDGSWRRRASAGVAAPSPVGSRKAFCHCPSPCGICSVCQSVVSHDPAWKTMPVGTGQYCCRITSCPTTTPQSPIVAHSSRSYVWQLPTHEDCVLVFGKFSAPYAQSGCICTRGLSRARHCIAESAVEEIFWSECGVTRWWQPHVRHDGGFLLRDYTHTIVFTYQIWKCSKHFASRARCSIFYSTTSPPARKSGAVSKFEYH